MDLVSSIRKTGSRGGVNFNWEDVATSNHRENYLGHSLKAPVGRWAKGRDLTWYANSDATGASATETEQEREERERKEELKRIKEAEENALARALGLPIAPRKGIDANATGANAVDVGEGRVTADSADPKSMTRDEGRPADKGRRSRKHDDSERRHRRRHRSRSYSRERRRDRSPRRRDEHRKHRPSDDREDRHGHRRRRSHSPGDRSGGGPARKVTDLGRGMDDEGEVEAPSGMGRVLNAVLEESLWLLSSTIPFCSIRMNQQRTDPKSNAQRLASIL
ncbi:kinase phosphorylation protein-domain-containing protein [Hypoxylon sp. FL1284]|nr:kinase phosphorylation protein-domain-containing protein [Hypoxylon sp. FL1284]